MKARLQSALNSQSIIEKLANRAIVKNFKLYYSLSMVLKDIIELQSALARFKEQTISGYAYGGPDGKGDPSIPPSKQEEANQKIYVFLDSLVELPGVKGKIRLSHFTQAEIVVAAVELAILDWLIKVDDPGDLFDEESSQ